MTWEVRRTNHAHLVSKRACRVGFILLERACQHVIKREPLYQRDFTGRKLVCDRRGHRLKVAIDNSPLHPKHLDSCLARCVDHDDSLVDRGSSCRIVGEEEIFAKRW